ncbi:hypothetical protein KY309_00780 [Candidatus Woesearchaeota archaeon]|nr:hypothetical protein [Candidatus Woesearchaeota archaeon]MBW3016129.1 hypothetical protein [Candidatus Woesearchaeota archaeon]
MKGQTKISMVFLGIIAIVALFGLLTMLKGNLTQLGIGVYDQGIAETYKFPPYRPGSPMPQYPAEATSRTIGSQTPILIFFKGEYGTMYEASMCWADLFPEIPSPKDMFSCYAVPVAGPMYEVTGWFPPTSAAMPKIYGGDIYCYLRTPYNREDMMDKLKRTLIPKGWITSIVNNQEVLNCQKGKYFIYPQGVRPGYYYG